MARIQTINSQQANKQKTRREADLDDWGAGNWQSHP